MSGDSASAPMPGSGRRRGIYRKILFAGLLALLPSAGAAEDLELSGHAKVQSSYTDHAADSIFSALGPDEYWDHELDLRGNARYAAENFAADLQAEFLGVTGDGVDAERRVSDALGLEDEIVSDRIRVFDLTADLSDAEDADAVIRIDRASVELRSDRQLLRAGRQAVTWGNGLVFHVMDLFNPFSPVEIDKDYKTGDDMVFGQQTFSDGSDLQLLAVGRRNPDSRTLSAGESSFAAKYRRSSPEYGVDLDLLAGEHVETEVFGIGVSKDVLEAVLRCDVVLHRASGGGTSTSLIFNLDRSWTVWDTNVYGYIEYFRNGDGVDEDSYGAPGATLADRVSRGEIFTVGRDYLSVGGRVEWTPRLNMYLNQILNLHDESGFSQARFEFSAAQDLFIMAGVNLPYGPNGSEFGGIEIAGTESFLSPGVTGYVRTAVYF